MTRQSAHVIVLGNEKGGSGKSTTALHLAVHLLYEGFKVATIDVDSRQQTLTSYMRRRLEWAKGREGAVPSPIHFHLPLGRSDSARENQRRDFQVFREAVDQVERHVDFIVIDTPGFDTHLSRLSHSLADTLVTPINDSLIDLDVMARFDPGTGRVEELGPYARLVQRARSERMAIDGKSIDWVLVRNRISMLASRNGAQVQAALDRIARRAGCRTADGIAERVIFRSLFPAGMTVFDPLGSEGGTGTSPLSARAEYRRLVSALGLPRRREPEPKRELALAL